jgi:hypothetical protein
MPTFFEKIKGLESFYLKEIDKDLMKSKKIDLNKNSLS